MDSPQQQMTIDIIYFMLARQKRLRQMFQLANFVKRPHEKMASSSNKGKGLNKVGSIWQMDLGAGHARSTDAQHRVNSY